MREIIFDFSFVSLSLHKLIEYLTWIGDDSEANPASHEVKNVGRRDRFIYQLLLLEQSIEQNELQSMFSQHIQPTQAQEFSDSNLNTVNFDISASSIKPSALKLPRISQGSYQAPPSRGQIKSKQSEREIPNLPKINSETQSQDGIEDKKESERQGGDDDFAMQIQQKLKLVMDNVNQNQLEAELIRPETSVRSDDQFDFEAIVNQNKELLKQQKFKNQSRVQSNQNLMEIKEKDDQKKIKTKSKTIKNGQRNESLYQRKVKDYKDLSSQNKYILKKKQIIAQKQQAQRVKASHSLKAKDKEEPIFIKNYNQNVPFLPKPPGKKNIQSKAKNSKPFSDAGLPIQNDNLFDNIHSFLQNPQKSNRSQNKLIPGNIKILEEKIKAINQKLQAIDVEPSATTEPTTHSNQTEIQRCTAKDWRRVELRSKQSVHCIDSNFQKEVERISMLQDRNSESLGKYVEGQKLMLELAMLKKSKKPDTK